MKIKLPNLELELLEQYKGRLKLGRVKLLYVGTRLICAPQTRREQHGLTTRISVSFLHDDIFSALIVQPTVDVSHLPYASGSCNQDCATMMGIHLQCVTNVWEMRQRSAYSQSG